MKSIPCSISSIIKIFGNSRKNRGICRDSPLNRRRMNKGRVKERKVEEKKKKKRKNEKIIKLQEFFPQHTEQSVCDSCVKLPIAVTLKGLQKYLPTFSIAFTIRETHASISAVSRTSTGEWMYRVAMLTVPVGIPSFVRCIEVASVVPPEPTPSW